MNDTPDYMPREGVNGFTLKGDPTSLVDAALQVYARTVAYPDSRALHEAAMAYRAELIRIVTEHRTRTITGDKRAQPIAQTALALMFAFSDECRTMSHSDRASTARTLICELKKLADEEIAEASKLN